MRKLYSLIGDTLGIIISVLVFITPFYFIAVNSFKDRRAAGLMNISWPEKNHALENYWTVLSAQDFMLVRAFINSAFITFMSIIILIFTCSMAGYVLQRRKETLSLALQFLILIGLMLPPAILPTIWVLELLHLFPTIWGIILVEVALQIPFVTMLYRSYMSTIPKEVEEAALVDGCNQLKLFFKIIFPLLKPVTATATVLSAVTIFNDFVNPLYFLPGAKNATVSLTLYNFMGKYGSSWNLLFADVVLITIPPLILFLFFNRRIVEGMAGTSLKG